MPRKAANAASDTDMAVSNPSVAGDGPPLEQPDERVKMLMGGLVNVAENTAHQLEGQYPGWAHVCRTFVDVVDSVMSTAS